MITTVYNMRIDFEFPPRVGSEDEYLERECEIEDDLMELACSQPNYLSAGMDDSDVAFLASYSRLSDALEAQEAIASLLLDCGCTIQKED